MFSFLSFFFLYPVLLREEYDRMLYITMWFSYPASFNVVVVICQGSNLIICQISHKIKDIKGRRHWRQEIQLFVFLDLSWDSPSCVTSKNKAPAITNTSSFEYTDFMGALTMSLWLVAGILADSHQQLSGLVHLREVWPPMSSDVLRRDWC